MVSISFMGNKDVLAVFCISTSLFILFSNSLHGDFVYDDSRAIVSNSDLRPSTPFISLFHNDFWGVPMVHSGSHKSYRPLTVLTFRLNYWIGELAPFGYHLFNTVLHCICTGLLYYLLTHSKLSFESRCLATVLFGVHPVHTEAVSGLVGRAELMATVFLLLSILCYMKGCRNQCTSPRTDNLLNKYIILSVLLAFCSMLSKEQGLTALGLCFLYELMYLIRRAGKVWRYGTNLGVQEWSSIWRCIILTLSTLAMTLFRFWIMGMSPPNFSPSDNPTAHCSRLLTRLYTFLYLPLFNTLLLVHPETLSFDWSMESIPLVESIFDYRLWCAVGFYAVLVSLGIKLAKTLIVEDMNCARRSPSPCLTKRTPSPVSRSPKFDLNDNIVTNGASNVCDCCKISRHKFEGNSNVFLEYRSVNNNVKSLVSSNNNNNNNYKTKFKGAVLSIDPENISVDIKDLNLSETSIFALGFLIMTFLPATNLLFYVGFVVAERVLYMPSIGYCILFSVGYQNLKESKKLSKRLIKSAVAILLTLYALRTFKRNFDWKNEESLYSSGLNINPAKAYSNLGNVFSSQGQKGKAEKAYRSALKYRPNMADTLFNLGTLLQTESRLEEAIQVYEAAIMSRERLASAHLNLGLSLWLLGRLDAAEERFEVCSSLSSVGLKDPRLHLHSRVSCLYNLGRLQAERLQYKTAIKSYMRAIRILDIHYPSAHSLYNLLGDAYLHLNQIEQAGDWFKKSLGRKPDHIPAHLTMSNWLIKQGKTNQAEELLLKASKIAPVDGSVYLHLGRLYLDIELIEKAITCLKQAIALTQNNFEAQFSLANAYRLNGQLELAETFYANSVALKPLDAVAVTNYGAILHANKKMELAQEQYLKALELNPEDDVTNLNLMKLRRAMKTT